MVLLGHKYDPVTSLLKAIFTGSVHDLNYLTMAYKASLLSHPPVSRALSLPFFPHSPHSSHVQMGESTQINLECPPYLLLSTLSSQWKSLVSSFSEDFEIMASCVKPTLSTMDVHRIEMLLSGATLEIY